MNSIWLGFGMHVFNVVQDIEMGIFLLKLQMNSDQLSMSVFIKTLIFALQDKF